jgi:hypothetical protein
MQRIAIIDSPLGGVMAKQIGALSGRLKLRKRQLDEKTIVEVAYDETDEWWEVKGGPLKKGVSLRKVAAHLERDPGIDEHENAIASDLKNLS